MKNTFPCVGFELQYSPLDRDCFENLAQSIHTISQDFIFDVTREVVPGQDILMLFSNSQNPTQYLPAEVYECLKLGNGHFRISVHTQVEARVQSDKAESVYLPISKGTSTAMVMTVVCPSCKMRSPFHYIANQEGDWKKGILPIYNCGACGTSRAMIGLLGGKV